MIRDVEEKKALGGIKISRDSPCISHILFADDTIIFCKATVAEGTEVIRIIDDYEKASGQKVNHAKCSVSFSSMTDVGTKQQILGGLGMREVRDQGKYLGLPLLVGRSKR
ncbi:hypothetical protein LIER_13978 [Lithospermum erythrorhizon]|uniref:Reverse transcriptase n=1 Tax=Lithospermum erythrorhizon TaxID=34254 RepID=A0AAV3PYX2_LITER